MSDTATLNGKGSLCVVSGCFGRVHGRGRCRYHYDRKRYEEATARQLAEEAEGEREELIHSELTYGCVAEWRSPHRTNSMFGDDDERRQAWEERREAIMEEYLTPPSSPGQRPWAWWEFEAGRPDHLEPYPDLDHFLDREHWSEDEEAEAYDNYENEPIIWMAANGHLTPDELAAITERANEARPRIGTDDEHYGSGGIDRADKRAVKLAEAVSEALAGAAR